MMKSIAHLGAASAAVLALAVGGAQAQKSKDTLRLAVSESIQGVEGMFFAGVDGFILDKMLQDPLLHFDTADKKVKPNLATEWKRIDPDTLEFKLRENVKFHNGAEFTADDVVYTFKIAIDPKYNFRLKESRYGYLKDVEKIDKYTVRVHLHKGSGVDPINLAHYPPILPHAVHSKFENKANFARETVGTGPYRLATYDSNGVTFRKAETYTWGGARPAAKIGTVAISSIGDKQTQIAKVLVGELELIFDVDLDQTQRITSSAPNYKVHVSPSAGFFFTNFDTANRSGKSPFGDKRLREAVLSAIDREALRKTYVPESVRDAQILTSMCHPWLGPCNGDVPEKLPTYDPARAKRLMADAGVPNGFEVEILTWSPAKEVAEAVAGDLRKVGIRASVNSPARNVFTKLRGDGKAVMQVTVWDNGGEPDIERTANYFFGDTAQNYVQDKELLELTEQGRNEIDPAKREKIYDRLFGKANAERYISPVIPAPSLIVHHKDVVMEDVRIIYVQGFALNYMSWAK
jgi:peptide/nickel transport system substrate-binding protein